MPKQKLSVSARSVLAILEVPMRIVVVSPSVQRFDATTHYWQAEFAACVAYLRTRFPHSEVHAEPAGLIGAPIDRTCGLLIDCGARGSAIRNKPEWSLIDRNPLWSEGE